MLKRLRKIKHNLHNLHFWLVSVQHKIVIYRSCNQFFVLRSVSQANLSHRCQTEFLFLRFLSHSWGLPQEGTEDFFFYNTQGMRITRSATQAGCPGKGGLLDQEFGMG